jgi:hypothetical protein
LNRVRDDAGAIEDLGRSVVAFDGPVVDGLVGDEGNGLLIQPSPERDVVHGSLLEGSHELKVEDPEPVLDCSEQTINEKRMRSRKRGKRKDKKLHLGKR